MSISVSPSAAWQALHQHSCPSGPAPRQLHAVRWHGHQLSTWKCQCQGHAGVQRSGAAIAAAGGRKVHEGPAFGGADEPAAVQDRTVFTRRQ